MPDRNPTIAILPAVTCQGDSYADNTASLPPSEKRTYERSSSKRLSHFHLVSAKKNVARVIDLVLHLDCQEESYADNALSLPHSFGKEN